MPASSVHPPTTPPATNVGAVARLLSTSPRPTAWSTGARRLRPTALLLLLLGGCATAAKEDPLAAALPSLEVQRVEARKIVPGAASVDAATRRRAVLALARLERLDAVPGIIDALDDGDDDVRATAAFAAGQIDLALDATNAAHGPPRAAVERALVQRLEVERAARVRTAVLRALGRVSLADGLQALLRVARTGPADERAVALTALGVSGARRAASLTRDDALRAAVAAALQDDDGAVVVAGAYAAFRQKAPVDAAALAAAAASTATQARIFLARALVAQDASAVETVLPALLRDADWRVRVEAVRAVVARHDPSVEQLVEPMVEGLRVAAAAARAPGELHVVRELCLALADVGAPAVALPAVTAAVAALGDDAGNARGACASAAVVLGGPADLVDEVTAGWSDERRRRQGIETAFHQRVSSIEKVRALRPFVVDDDARVRIAAAGALCATGGPDALDGAATRLLDEDDPGAASAFLECFADGNGADVLRDRTLEALAARLFDAATPEAAEPLLAIAALARARPTLSALVARLAEHPDVRVRDTARGIPTGERSPGARAAATTPPSPATLPLAAILNTSRGEITLAFERELAPVATQTFAQLARRGTYRGTPFHRVIADFVAQGGDPRGDGSGGPGFFIPCENSDAPFTRGAVGIATAGKDTGGSQFFLVHSDQPHLDGRYTLFARVIDGQDVVDALQRDDVLVDVELTTALRKTVRTPAP
jgi:cyclophilin family peptidyl-prolyl cis-trans isomerase/HEAT repeat protein